MKCLCLAVCLSAFAFAELPRGWEFSSTHPESYLGAVERGGRSGQGSGHLKSVAAVNRRHFALFTQKVNAVPYRGRRLRWGGYVRSQQVTGWAGLFVRVDGPGLQALEFDNMQNRPILGTTDWTRHTIEIDVPNQGQQILFGLLLAGGGEVWLDDASLETIGPALPGARERQKIRHDGLPVNLDFEAGGL